MKYGKFGDRFAAGIIDGFAFVLLDVFDRRFYDSERGVAIIIIWSIISYSSYWIYSVFLHARYGQTIGKRVTKIRVLDIKSRHIPTFKQSLLRESGYIILNLSSLCWCIYLLINYQYSDVPQLLYGPGLMLTISSFGWLLIEVLSMMTNRKRRAIQDYISGTIVTKI